MPGTRAAIEVGTCTANLALLIVAIMALLICLTVITLVLSVERSDRVKAIQALTPVLLALGRATGIRRSTRATRSRGRAGNFSRRPLGDAASARGRGRP